MINEYENTLRLIIILVIGEQDDASYGVSPERVLKWKEKRDLERIKYKDILTEKRIIFYSDFYDLGVIIDKNWEKFKDIFHDKKKFSALYSIMETYRNTIAHGRLLFSYQEKLIEGITGELKASIVKFHNKNMHKDDYFIRIIRVSDNLGNSWESGKWSGIAMISDGILRVGDNIEIRIDAFDPKGRKIEYSLYHQSNISNKIINDSGIFPIEITKEMISPISVFQVTALTEEENYENKNSISLHYTVLPL